MGLRCNSGSHQAAPHLAPHPDQQPSSLPPATHPSLATSFSHFRTFWFVRFPPYLFIERLKTKVHLFFFSPNANSAKEKRIRFHLRFSENEFYQWSRLFFCSLFVNVNADAASHHLEIEKQNKEKSSMLTHSCHKSHEYLKITAWIGQYSETATRTNQCARGEHVPLPQCSSTSCSSSSAENVRCQKCCVPRLLLLDNRPTPHPQKVKLCSFGRWAQSTITSNRAPWVQTDISSDVSPILQKKNQTQRRAWGRSTTSNCADMNSNGAYCASVSQATFSIFRKINERAHPQRLPRLRSL